MTVQAIAREAANEIDTVVANAARENARVARGDNVVELPVRKEKGAPTPAQQEALVIKYRTKARKLGRSILRRWHARLDVEEVDSLVDLSLCEAVRRFNPYKGASFMTFLYYHLKGNLVRAVANAANSHSIPIYNVGEGEELKPDNGFQFRSMTANEVAEALSNNEVVMPDEALWRKELHNRSSVACEKLDSLEKDIIHRIFLKEEQIMDIASELGYSRCHISRVKKRALETLYDELRVSLDTEDLGRKVEIEEEDEIESIERRVADRRTIHRRRPRSKRSPELRKLHAVA